MYKAFSVTFVLLALLSLASCEDSKDTAKIAGSTLIAIGAYDLLSDDDDSDNDADDDDSDSGEDSPNNPSESTRCRGLNNTVCNKDLVEESIWNIQLNNLSSNTQPRELGDLTDFAHFLKFFPESQTWESYLFLAAPGFEVYLGEKRSGNIVFTNEEKNTIILNTISSSCGTEHSAFSLFDDDDLEREIARPSKSTLNLTYVDFDSPSRAQDVIDDADNLIVLFLFNLAELIVAAVIDAIEIMLTYLTSPDFWQEFILDGSFFYETHLQDQLSLYLESTTLSCISEQGIKDFYETLLLEHSDEDIKEQACTAYIIQYELDQKEDKGIYDNCKDFIAQQLINELVMDHTTSKISKS